MQNTVTTVTSQSVLVSSIQKRLVGRGGAKLLKSLKKILFFLVGPQILKSFKSQKKSYFGFSGGKNRKSFKNPIFAKKNPLKK